jgi:hypothetical protein
VYLCVRECLCVGESVYMYVSVLPCQHPSLFSEVAMHPKSLAVCLNDYIRMHGYPYDAPPWI